MPAPRLESLVLALLVQRLQRWENMLRQDEGGETASPQSLPVAENPPPSSEYVPVPPMQPPAHWVKNLHSNEPPAHWLEMVRQKAPGLLDGTGRGVLQARRTTPTSTSANRRFSDALSVSIDSSPAAAKSEIAHYPKADTGEEQPTSRPRLTFSVSEEPPPKSPVYPAQDKHRPQPLFVYTSPDDGESRPVTGTVQQREATPQPDVSLGFGQARELMQTTWTETPRAESSSPPSLTINEAQAASSSVWINENASTITAYSFPRYEELSPLKSRPAPKTESPTVPTEQKAVFSETETLTLSQMEHRQSDSVEGAWPELPMLDSSSNADEDTFLRNWKHRERLDKEQRGVGWSEPLS